MAKKNRRDEEVHSILTLFMLVHLGLASDADGELAKHGLTRTHHRILYLVIHGPGVTVGKVVEVLRLTPQAVQGPMRRLLSGGFIEQRASSEDRRKRHLYATPKGEALLRTVSEKQFERIAQAFDGAPRDAVEHFRLMLSRLADPEDLAWAERLPAAEDKPRPRPYVRSGAVSKPGRQRKPTSQQTPRAGQQGRELR